MLKIKNKYFFLFIFVVQYTGIHSLSAQQGWESNALSSAEYFFAANAFGPAAQYYQVQGYYPNLQNEQNAAEFYSIASALRRNTAGAEKMLTAFMIDHPTNYLTETAFFDVANFYFDQGKYSYALKWYSKISEKEIAKVQRPSYNFNKAYTFFASKRYKNAKPLFEKIKELPDYQNDANYYLGYIAYQLEDFEEANRNFEKLNRKQDDNTVGYFQADMNFKLGRFEKAIALARKSLKGADEKETSELSKIIGESYFNLKDYRSALPYLMEYKGKRGKWNNTDNYQLGYAFYRINDYQKAIEQFNKIISGKNAVAQNAYYHLADSYLQTQQQTAALNAFKRASEMKFDAVIAEDALLNYARLSYTLGNSYESPSAVLQRFIKTYPKNEAVTAIEELLLDSYVNSQNFDAALDLLEKLSASQFNEARQKVFYLKATSLYKTGQFKEAIEFYASAIKAHSNAYIIATSLYWQAQAYFELKEYALALETFLEAKAQPKFASLDGAELFDYHVGYAYFNLKNYPQALTSFERFLSTAQSVNYERDTRLRMGDSHFVLKAYWPAMDQYEKATVLQPQKGTYAMFQQAISYGFVNRTQQKIALLQDIINQFPNSNLVDDCQFELALAYTKLDDTTNAIATYDALIGQFADSPYRSKSLLNKGLILFNNEAPLEANTVLKQLVETYPNEALAQQALQTVKEIAIEQNTVDAFSAWLKGIDVAAIPDLEIEKASFDAIERLLNDGKKKPLKRALQSYLAAYVEGGNSIRAAFLLAELAFEEEEWVEATAQYAAVIDQPFDTYTEQSLVRITQALLQMEERDKAFLFWQKLEELAQFEENKRYAQFNLMQYYFQTQKYPEAIAYAESILALNNIEEQIN